MRARSTLQSTQRTHLPPGARPNVNRVVVASLSMAVLLFVAKPARASSAAIEFPSAATRDPVALSAAMPQIADAVLAAYQEPDERRRLDNTFRLQIVAARYDEARKTLSALRAMQLEREPDAGAA